MHQIRSAPDSLAGFEGGELLLRGERESDVKGGTG